MKLVRRNCLHFLKKLERNVEEWASPHFWNVRSLDSRTTGRVEGLNGIVKQHLNVHSKMTEAPRLEINMAFLRSNRESCEDVYRSVTRSTNCSYLHSTFDQILTKKGFELLQKEYDEYKNYSVRFRKSTFEVSRGEKKRKIFLIAAKHLSCSCGIFNRLMLPCRHVIAINDGIISPEDVHFRWKMDFTTENHVVRTINDGAPFPSLISDKWKDEVSDGGNDESETVTDETTFEVGEDYKNDFDSKGKEKKLSSATRYKTTYEALEAIMKDAASTAADITDDYALARDRAVAIFSNAAAAYKAEFANAKTSRNSRRSKNPWENKKKTIIVANAACATRGRRPKNNILQSENDDECSCNEE